MCLMQSLCGLNCSQMKRESLLLLLRVGQSPVVVMGREIGAGTVGILAGDGGSKLFISSLK